MNVCVALNLSTVKKIVICIRRDLGHWRGSSFLVQFQKKGHLKEYQDKYYSSKKKGSTINNTSFLIFPIQWFENAWTVWEFYIFFLNVIVHNCYNGPHRDGLIYIKKYFKIEEKYLNISRLQILCTEKLTELKHINRLWSKILIIWRILARHKIISCEICILQNVTYWSNIILIYIN